MKYLIFIFATLFSICLVNSQLGACGPAEPKLSKDCTSLNSSSRYCCFLSATLEGVSASGCYSAPITNLPTGTTKIGDMTYTIDCGTGVKADDTCSLHEGKTITSKSDCSVYSTATNSCCMMELAGAKGCQFVGSKITADIESNGVKFQCSSNYITLSYVLALIFAFVFI